MTNIESNGDNVGSAFFSRVPVVTVHKENIDQVKETLVSDIQVFNHLTLHSMMWDWLFTFYGSFKNSNHSCTVQRVRNISLTINIITELQLPSCWLWTVWTRGEEETQCGRCGWEVNTFTYLNHLESSCRYRNTCLVAKTRSIISLGKCLPIIRPN